MKTQRENALAGAIGAVAKLTAQADALRERLVECSAELRLRSQTESGLDAKVATDLADRADAAIADYTALSAGNPPQ